MIEVLKLSIANTNNVTDADTINVLMIQMKHNILSPKIIIKLIKSYEF